MGLRVNRDCCEFSLPCKVVVAESVPRLLLVAI